MIRKLDIGLDNGEDLGNQYGGSEYILSAYISNDIHKLGWNKESEHVNYWHRNSVMFAVKSPHN